MPSVVATPSPFRLRMPELKELFTVAYGNWSEDKVPRIAAAFSFYAVLSLAPLLILAVAIAGIVVGEEAVRSRVLHEAAIDLGKGTAEFLATIINKTSSPSAGIFASILGLLVSLWGASNLFAQLEDAMMSMWCIVPKGSAIKNFLISRVIAILMVFAFAVVVAAWLGVDSWLGWLARRAEGFPGWQAVSFLVSVVLLTGIFAVVFRMIPKGMVAWGDVWFPAFFTAFFFALGKFALSQYFAYSGVSAAYGSAGALVVILLWTYYTSQIFFFGGELTYSFAHTFGSQVGRTEPIRKSDRGQNPTQGN